MEKRYQVFVSSTYEDLKEERQIVIQSLLEFDCIPVGMEFFPAADDTAWEVIKSVIEDCDYYVVIVAGRYGSLSPKGISYTQQEYQHAVDKGIPVIAFLHGAPGKLPVDKTEGKAKAKKKLGQFRELCEKRLCKYWKTATELGGAVVISLNQLIKTNPRIGWVKADQVPDESASKEILRLKNSIEELEKEREGLRTSPPVGTELLLQGDDPYDMNFGVDITETTGPRLIDMKGYSMIITITRTWNQIFYILAPAMIREADENILHQLMNGLVSNTELERIVQPEFQGSIKVIHYKISTDHFHTIIIQLRSLGLITQSEKPRSLKDTGAYWKLTPYGDNVMTRMRALKRKSSKKKRK